MAILADILQKTQMIATSTVIKSFLMAILAAHHSTMKVIWMLTKTIMLMTAVMVAITQVVVRHRPVTSVIYVTMYILVMKITMATAPHPHVMWYWTPMKIGKNTVTMIQITVPNHQEMVDQVVVRHRPVTSVIYVTMYILVMKITMATAPHPHVMWYWTPMKIGKNTVTMIQITVLNRQMVINH
jgi:hypothetical protein